MFQPVELSFLIGRVLVPFFKVSKNQRDEFYLNGTLASLVSVVCVSGFAEIDNECDAENDESKNVCNGEN